MGAERASFGAGVAVERSILVLNGGSSSIKFALYGTFPLACRLSGNIDRIGHEGARLSVAEQPDGRKSEQALAAGDHRSATDALIEWLAARDSFAAIEAVGHRVVHGMDHVAPERVTPGLLDELRRIEPIDPDHLPLEIEMIEAVARRYPRLPQVVCFDTAFHRTLPRVAQLLPIPRRFDANGIRRYGFHGLSYEYLMEALQRCAGVAAARGRVVLAHLGSGASMAAVID